jgi:pyridoxal phosphate enzyme (YggS family)
MNARMLLKASNLAPDAAARLRANLERVASRIHEAALRARRDPAGVALVAVTKYVDPAVVRLLHEAGVRDFGESTVQRADSLRACLADLSGVRWHLIGHLQRNKAARALSLFASIHSVDSERLVREIGTQSRKRSLAAPSLYAEVNLTGEAAKTGLEPGNLRGVLSVIRDEGLSASGLMTMAPYEEDPEASRPIFRRLRALRDELARERLLPAGAGLSMGMSGDFTVAVEEGATSVRIGSALFEGLAGDSTCESSTMP